MSLKRGAYFLFIILITRVSLSWAAWVQVGNDLNLSANHTAKEPSISFTGTTLYVSWSENNADAYQVFEKYSNGASWAMDASAVNPHLPTGQPSCMLFTGDPGPIFTPSTLCIG